MNAFRCSCSRSFICSTLLNTSGVSTAARLPYTAACTTRSNGRVRGDRGAGAKYLYWCMHLPCPHKQHP